MKKQGARVFTGQNMLLFNYQEP